MTKEQRAPGLKQADHTQPRQLSHEEHRPSFAKSPQFLVGRKATVVGSPVTGEHTPETWHHHPKFK